MILILLAALGTIIGLWAKAQRTVRRTVSSVDGPYLPSACGSFSLFNLLNGGRWRVAAGPFLLTAIVVAGIVKVGSQTLAPTNSPGDAGFYLARGESFSSSKEYDRAIADYTLAIGLKPNYAEAYNDRGFAYYLKGDFSRAISDFTRAIELRPDYPKAYNSRGVAYMQGGYGATKSVPDFDRAIELKPDFRYAYINRANARFLWHPRLALEDFHRAGMHPELTVGILVCALTSVPTIAFLWRRKRIRRLGNPDVR